MQIKINELKNLLARAAGKFVSVEEAQYFAAQQVDTYLKKQPRTGHLADAISDLKAWQTHPDAKMEIESEKPASLLLNFHALGPALKLKYVHDEAERRAKENGISLIGLNHGGVHTLNLWADGLGQRDMIAIFLYNGGPNGVVPFGGTRGLFGTNPLAYAVPTTTEPIIVDMATSEIPFFEIRNAKKEQRALRSGVAVDSTGKLTTDPSAALTDDGVSNLLGLGGGYKGYALVLLIEILTGSLIRSLLSTEMSKEYIMEEHGGVLITIDIGSFTDINKFKASVTAMCQQIRQQKPAAGIDQITVPGDRSYLRRDQLLAQGEVGVNDDLLSQLQAYT